MDAPESVTYAQGAFAIFGIVPMLLGVRSATGLRGNLRWTVPERIAMPMVWAGLTIWTVGGFFALTKSIIWFDAFGIALAIVTLAVDVFLWYMAIRLQRSITNRSLHDQLEREANEDEH